ncbi:MAG: resolvase protein [Thermoplasmatales archaeon A-plasma]|nr:MAG: resolvase protein [Thermoplasmatales archaeon A-plasma]
MSNDTIRHVVGYARVSTRDQDLSSQVERIQRYISDYGLIPAIEGAIFQEKLSGISNQRPERTKIMKLAEQGKIDLVICTKLDRWGRSLKDLIETMNFLESKKVNMVFLDQNIDLSSPMGKMLFQILGAVAEFERNLIVERTQEGRVRAMLHGTRSGKPMHGPLKDLPEKTIIQRYKNGESIKSLASEYRVSPNTIRKTYSEKRCCQDVESLNSTSRNNGEKTIIQLDVKLDDIDRNILDILKKHTLPMKAIQIQAVLNYMGYDVSYGILSKKLSNLTILSLVSRGKGSRVYRYGCHLSLQS